MESITYTIRRNIMIPDGMDSESFVVPDSYVFDLRDLNEAYIDPTDDGASGMALAAMTCKYRGGSVRFVVASQSPSAGATTVLVPVEVAARFTVAQLAILADIDVTRAFITNMFTCNNSLVLNVSVACD